MKRIALLASVAALLAGIGATAATPAQYRVKLNGICRGYTLKLKRHENTMKQTTDTKTYDAALQRFFVVWLAEDAQLETIPVPSSMRARMMPILRLLKKIDVHLRAAAATARANAETESRDEWKTITKLVASINRQLDAAGLRDCGSNQA